MSRSRSCSEASAASSSSAAAASSTHAPSSRGGNLEDVTTKPEHDENRQRYDSASPSPSHPASVADSGAREREDNGKRLGSPSPAAGEASGSEEAEEDDEPAKLHVSGLTRNVTEEHLNEIFATFGKLSRVELVLDRRVGLSRGFAYVEYDHRKDAEEAQLYMDGGQLDGAPLKVNFVLLGGRPGGAGGFSEAGPKGGIRRSRSPNRRSRSRSPVSRGGGRERDLYDRNGGPPERRGGGAQWEGRRGRSRSPPRGGRHDRGRLPPGRFTRGERGRSPPYRRQPDPRGRSPPRRGPGGRASPPRGGRYRSRSPPPRRRPGSPSRSPPRRRGMRRSRSSSVSSRSTRSSSSSSSSSASSQSSRGRSRSSRSSRSRS